MAHLHEVRDFDTHYVIDPITMAITNANEAKNKLMLGDHDSEIYTFEIPREVEGHDMSLCNMVEVHFINISADRASKSVGVYPVKDLAPAEDAEDTLVFTWKVSGESTMYAGSLNYRIKFACLDENGKYTYKKWTDVYKGITISDGFDNGAAVEKEYSDILSELEARLDALEQGGATYVLTDADKQEIANMVEIPEGDTVELDTTLTASGKAADAKAVGDAVAKKLDKSGGTLNGNLTLKGSIVIPMDGSSGIRDAYDMPILRYDKVDGELRFRLGQTGARLTMFSSERPLYNGEEIALKREVLEVGTVTDEQIASAVEDYFEENPVTGGAVATVETFRTQPIGQLFEQPVNYAFWSPQSLRWDKNLGKYVDVIYGTTNHLAGASAHSLWVSYIDPDTLTAEAPVQCRYVDADGNDVTLDDAGTGAWMILDDGKYLLFNFISGKMYRFISSDYGKTWVQEQECSGYPSTQELYFLVKLSNGRLLANSCEMKGIARSDDMGVTWNYATPTNSIGGNLMAEINFFEVKPGVVIAIGRYSASGVGVNESGDCQHAVISYSEDYGTTWTPWKLSDTIDNMNASCCTGYVHDGILELFTGSRWYHRGTNATTDYTNTGKSGAITHYTATIENALADKFTNMGVVVYSKAQGDSSSQDFHTPCVAVNGKDMLLVYCDRVYPYTEEKTNHYFVRGYLGGSMDYAPKDEIVSAVFPYSSEKIMHLLAKQKSELIVLMNEAILNNKPVVPDGGGDGSGGAYAYILDGIVANFNMLDASKYDAEAVTIADSVNGLTATLYGGDYMGTKLTELPTIRDNSVAKVSVRLPQNTLSEYISDESIEMSLEWSQYRYEDDPALETGAFLFSSGNFRVAAYGMVCGNYLKTDGTTYEQCGNIMYAAGYGGTGGYIVDELLASRSTKGHTHSVVTYSKDGMMRTYKNGVKTGECVMPDFLKWEPKLLANELTMGGHCRSMRIYSRPLTDAEVLNNYEYEKQFVV